MRAFAPKQKQPQKTVSSSPARPNTATSTPHHGASPNILLQLAMGTQATQRMKQTNVDDLEVHGSIHDPTRFAHDFSRIPLHSTATVNLQAKLMVNTPGDIYEQEADRVSEQVMSMSDPQLQPASACGGTCTECQAAPLGRDRELLQAKRVGSVDLGHTAIPPATRAALKSTGQPLDVATRAFMEPRFGHDFSQVRVHTDREAEESSRFVSAVAYTVGHNIVFGHGQYAPHTDGGRRLLAHELSHVVQQSTSGSGTSVAGLVLQRQVVDPRALTTETITTPRHIHVSEWLDVPMAGGGNSHTAMYWVNFEVDDKGVLRASVQTVSPDRAYRSGLLRFGDRFRAALQHFSDNGVQVNAFEGDWSYMTKDEISENLRVFREGMAAGKTREEAARETPSGKVATRSGFELTSVENVPESQEHLAEEGVRRWRVKAVFRRAPAVPKPGPTGGGLGVKPGGSVAVNISKGGTTTELQNEPTIRPGRGRLTAAEEAEEGGGEFEGGGGLIGVGAVVVEVIGPMLQALAWALIPALSNKLWEQDKKKLEAEVLQRLNQPDTLRRTADYQIDQPGLALYGNVTVEITTEDALQTVGTTESGFPIMNAVSYYSSSRLIDVRTSDREVKHSTETRSHRNLPGQSTTMHIVTQTYSFVLPQLENKFIRARLKERIAELDREMSKSASQLDNFSLELMRDELRMRLRLHQYD
jgi:hypothetical protein